MKTKKNNIITVEECKAVDEKSKGISLGTRRNPKSLLEAIDNINTKLSAIVRESDGDLILSEARGNNVDYLAKRMHLTPLQTVVFCICVEVGPCNIDFRNFARALHVTNAQALTLVDTLNELVRCRLLGLACSYGSKTSSYNISARALKTLISNEDYEAPQRTFADTEGLLSYYHDFLSELEEEGIR